MSEEYKALKAQKDELDQKSKQQYINRGAAAERERIRVAVENFGGLTIGKNDYVTVKDVLSLLKDGDGE